MGRDIPAFLKVEIMDKFARVYGRTLAAVGSALALGQANAAIDITAATTGIADASTAVLAVLAAMIVMAAAVFGVRKVLQLIRG